MVSNDEAVAAIEYLSKYYGVPPPKKIIFGRVKTGLYVNSRADAIFLRNNPPLSIVAHEFIHHYLHVTGQGKATEEEEHEFMWRHGLVDQALDALRESGIFHYSGVEPVALGLILGSSIVLLTWILGR